MEEHYWTRTGPLAGATRSKTRRLSRRSFLAGAAGAGLLVACGGNKTNNAARTSSGAPVATSASTGGATAAATAQANVPKGGSLTKSIIATDAKGFHPYLTTDSPSAEYQGYVWGSSGLTHHDPATLALIPLAAQKWTLSDDKKTYTFTLKDMKWSDGIPVTTADYVWSYEQAKKPENKYPYITNFDAIESYVAKDDKTLVVTMTDPLVVGLEQSDVITPLPKHIWEKLDWSDSTKNSEILSPTVGNGIFKLKEWKKDDHATFLANDLTHEGRPNIDSLTIRVIGTPALAYQALKSGEIDWNSGIQPSDYKEAKTLSNINVPEWYPARGSWGYVGFNLRRDVVKDPLVRKAIAFATDRKGIIDAAFFSLAKPIYSSFVQESWVYNPNVEHYDFSPDKSKELLKQAGYALNGNKKLAKDGKELKLKLVYPTSSKPREAIATILQQQLGDLGIALDVQGLEFQAYVSAIQKDPWDFDLQLGAWNATIEPHFLKQIWAEKGIPSLNAGAYVNKQVEDLFDQGGKEFDREKRKAIYGQIQKILTDDLPYVFVYEALNYAGVNKKVGGISPTPLGIDYNLDKWYISKQ
ncbi:MAG: ABC transporter substrate-binding protein [Dehalococcoidia bacterium]